MEALGKRLFDCRCIFALEVEHASISGLLGMTPINGSIVSHNLVTNLTAGIVTNYVELSFPTPTLVQKYVES